MFSFSFIPDCCGQRRARKGTKKAKANKVQDPEKIQNLQASRVCSVSEYMESPNVVLQFNDRKARMGPDWSLEILWTLELEAWSF